MTTRAPLPAAGLLDEAGNVAAAGEAPAVVLIPRQRPDPLRRAAAFRAPEPAERAAEPDRPAVAVERGDHLAHRQHRLMLAVAGHLHVYAKAGEVVDRTEVAS
jgi:hypothetical protein